MVAHPAGWHKVYFYPRPPRGGRRTSQPDYNFANCISIHALREEGDAAHQPGPCGTCDFYPRPPRGGRRGYGPRASAVQLFLSTPSARRATKRSCPPGCRSCISIHALREEGDWPPIAWSKFDRLFLSTPSARRATASWLRPPLSCLISIHALREEGDHPGLRPHRRPPHFYPRPPRGGRRTGFWATLTPTAFLSTPSARRATNIDGSEFYEVSDFYPRPPRGGRPLAVAEEARVAKFLSTPSARRATLRERFPHWPYKFLSTPSARRATLLSGL